MIVVSTGGAYYHDGQWLEREAGKAAGLPSPEAARAGTIAWRILNAHTNDPADGQLRIRFDAMASHDITFVGIIQTARAGGMTEFPLPYVLTNCHNSLCAVGGTINEDDHLFGLSAAQKYGGDYVPPHVAVIHQYVREMLAGCGKMILGSDSHTRYGALGTLGFGEGGPELVKQLLGLTYDLSSPEVVAVYLHGEPKAGVGPQDVALALIKAVFKDGVVKNKILEFVGPGVGGLSVDYRLGIDVMTTETTCLSSIWQTDELVKKWLATHGRSQDYQALSPTASAWYDQVIRIDLGRVEPMIALPFHPSNAWTIREFLDNAEDLLAGVEAEAVSMLKPGTARPNLRAKLKNGAFMVDQGIIAGCSGGIYESMVRTEAILRGQSTGNGAFGMSVYPASLPQYQELLRTGLAASLIEAGVTLKTAFCGPCFGAGDVPANNTFSIRHTTRNFPSREGSKPTEGQMAYVALMDARSIAATAANQGRLTAATDLPSPPPETPVPYTFNPKIYQNRVYRGYGTPRPEQDLVFGPNITDWPSMIPLPENLLLSVAAAIYDPVTTTDELIPSGETSSYRSNPLRLAEFALSRKDPLYVGRAKEVLLLEQARRAAGHAGAAHPRPGQATDTTCETVHLETGSQEHVPVSTDGSAKEECGQNTVRPFDGSIQMKLKELFARFSLEEAEEHTGLGSLVFAIKPGDGSAREQAASCQKVLGGWANIASDYATKRYRANLVNWGMLPLVLDQASEYTIQPGDWLFLPGIRQALITGLEQVPAILHQGESQTRITLQLPAMSRSEREIILAGCLINYHADKKKPAS